MGTYRKTDLKLDNHAVNGRMSHVASERRSGRTYRLSLISSSSMTTTTTTTTTTISISIFLNHHAIAGSKHTQV